VKRLLISGWLVLLAGAAFFSCGRPPASSKRLIVLGMDGLDPQLLRRFLDAGKLPNFSALAARGGMLPLTTSNPPQSPVAWSNLITGMNPGGHGIYDFIHRDPATLTPYLSTSKVVPPSRTLKLGDWVLPLSGGQVTLLRKGRAFWEILDQHRIPATIYRMPANFPPVATRARTLAGMGTPDLLGTYGTFSLFTDDPLQQTGALNGGRAYLVQREGSRIVARLEGPYNTLRRGEPAAVADFTVFVDPLEPVAKIVMQGREILLKEGEWSDWVRVEFRLAPLVTVTGICKFYLKQAQPRFSLYVTPLNIDPAHPALPLSTPADYAAELAEELGPYFTQGIAEDTKALTTGVLNDAEYLQQARMVLDEQLRAYRAELARFRSGLFFFYFSSIDLNSHMFWRALDPAHPAHTAEVAAQFGGLLEELYVEMDRAVGQALTRLDADTSLIVLSDHGFAPYNRSFNLNTWLLENGYLALKAGVDPAAAGDFLINVDWSRTRAYGIGLNSLYLNLRGRERAGIVAAGPQADALLAELRARLLELADSAGRESDCGARQNCQQVPAPRVLGRVDRATDAYSGAQLPHAPDLVLGYNRGYRAGWSTVLGGFSRAVLEDNLEPWSGDHCMDFTQVPGVLLSSRKITAPAPALTDVAPTILAEFGIAAPKETTGRPLW
jgi:predicted AlkP superfamily phosphohydrolase/phosphomutase